MKLLFLTILIFSLNAFAHEDHSIPGVIPTAPHGGTIGELKAIHTHKHNVKEIFFEGIFKNGELKIYPLEIDKKNNKVFSAMKVDSFKSVDFSIEDPRQSKTISAVFDTNSNSWKAIIQNKRVRRLIISTKAIYKKLTYEGKVQVERK